MSDRNPAAYTGFVSGSTTRQGDVQFDPSDFGVVNGVVSLSGTGAVETINSLSPTAGNIIVAGTAGEVDIVNAGSTVTLSLDPDLPLEASVTLTSAQVKALAATQITLVAAPGAGKMIQFLSATMKLDYGGTNAFTESGDNLAIKFTDDSGVAVSQTIEMTAFITATVDTYTNAQPAINAIVAATGADNQALVLDNVGSEIAGNAAADNALVVSVLYRVVSI